MAAEEDVLDARAVLAEAKRLRETGTDALAETATRKAAARKAYDAARDEVVVRQIAEMPV